VKLRNEFTISERRACRVIDQPRSCQRYVAKPRGDEDALVKRMLQLVRQRPRFGYRRIAALLRCVACERHTDLPTMASRGPESASKEAKTQTLGKECERLPPTSGPAQRPRLVLGLRVRSYDQWQHAEVAVDRG
jgi:hypothetical protein